jgi:hypothetical protein
MANKPILPILRYIAYGVLPAILWIEGTVSGSIAATYALSSLGPLQKNLVRGVIATWVVVSATEVICLLSLWFLRPRPAAELPGIELAVLTNGTDHENHAFQPENLPRGPPEGHARRPTYPLAGTIRTQETVRPYPITPQTRDPLPLRQEYPLYLKRDYGTRTVNFVPGEIWELIFVMLDDGEVERRMISSRGRKSNYMFHKASEEDFEKVEVKGGIELAVRDVFS